MSRQYEYQAAERMVPSSGEEPYINQPVQVPRRR